MRNNRMMTLAICAVLLGAMTACHAAIDHTAAAGGTSTAAAAVVAEAAETSEAPGFSEGTASASDGYSADTESNTQASGAQDSTARSPGTQNSSVQSSGTQDSTAQTSGTQDATQLDVSALFTDRDLAQEADLTGATYRTVSDGETITIKEAGVYVISGTAANAQIQVAAGDEDKVQIVLDGVSITNDSIPAIYVKNADKVFVTTTDSDNSLSVTGAFTADGTTNTDAVIFSKDDLVLNGVGTLTISSTGNGITSKDDLKVTGGTIVITCTADGLEANDSIRIADGTVTITTDKDGLHAENDEDNSLGYVYIGGGTLTVTAGDDAIHATTVAQVDGGTLNLTGAECIEGTYIRINDGTISITASDDGINAGQKSNISTPTVEINGGAITIAMGAGDTDGIDSNGNLYLNGGTLDITAQSPFDYDGTAENNGATIIVNGEQTDTITNQMMGGHGGPFGGDGGHGGPFGGHRNGGAPFGGDGTTGDPLGNDGTQGDPFGNDGTQGNPFGGQGQ